MTEVQDVPEETRTIDRFQALGFFPADHAAAESGKIYASGAYWTHLRFPAFPAVLPSMALVAVLRQPFHESHENHRFEMTMENADRERLPTFKVEGEFRATAGVESKYGDAGIIPLAVPLHGVLFERAGDHSFVLSVNGAEIARYKFSVLQVFGTIPSSP